MTKLLALLALSSLAPFALAEEAAKPAPVTVPEKIVVTVNGNAVEVDAKTAEALATPVDQRNDEQKALVYASIQAGQRARAEKERLLNVRELATVRAEKIDLAGLIDGKLTDADGKPVSIDYIKKARFVAFYHSSSWCCGCKQFTPELIEATKKYGPTDLAIVFVSWDDTPEITQKYMHKAGFTWPSLTRKTLAKSPARLAIRGIPHLRVYDASGSLVADSINDNGRDIAYARQFSALDKLISTPAAASATAPAAPKSDSAPVAASVAAK